MDLVDGNNGGVVNNNVVVGTEEAKPCVKRNLSPVLDSPLKKRQLSSSTESIYEIVDELEKNGDSEDESFIDSEDECDSNKNINDNLNELDVPDSQNQNGIEDLSDTAEMEEVLEVIDDDDNATSGDKNDCNSEKSDSKIAEKLSVNNTVSMPGLSSNIEDNKPTLDGSSDLDTNKVTTSDTNLILSSDDEDMDGLLEEFREEGSSDENSSAAKDSVEMLVKQTESSEQSARKSLKAISILKPITGKSNSIQNSNSSLRCTATQDSCTAKREIELVICDEKSNDSIVILDDSPVKDALPKTVSNDISPATFNNLNSPLKSPSFSSSSEDKFEFDSTLLDIVDDSVRENPDKKDTSNLDFKPCEISKNKSSCNELESLNSKVELPVFKSNVNSTCSSENLESTNFSDGKSEESKSSSLPNISAKYVFVIPNKSLCDDKQHSNTVSETISGGKSCLSSNSNLFSSTIVTKDVNSDSEAQLVSHDAIAVEAPKSSNQSMILFAFQF